MQVTAGFWRRFCALFYDGLILLAFYFFITAILVSLNHEQAISPQNHYFQILLFLIWVIFYLFFWCKSGQTIGMLAWGIKLQNRQGKPISIFQGLLRLSFAIPSYLFFGLGIFIIFFSKKKLTLHDRLSKTEVVIIRK